MTVVLKVWETPRICEVKTIFILILTGYLPFHCAHIWIVQKQWE